MEHCLASQLSGDAVDQSALVLQESTELPSGWQPRVLGCWGESGVAGGIAKSTSAVARCSIDVKWSIALPVS